MATEKLAEGIRGFSAGVWLQTPVLSSSMLDPVLKANAPLPHKRMHVVCAELVRVFLHACACVCVCMCAFCVTDLRKLEAVVSKLLA
jgi:hypothetical protein